MSDDYFDIGDYRREVTTSSPEAQLWFDRGLAWTYAFNPEEGVHCFEKAAQADPQCAMAHWGIAFASGPNYNKAWKFFDPADFEITLPYAHAALERARAVAGNATPFERALIEALATRFPATATDDLQEFHRLNVAYAEAMRAVYHAHPDDFDAAALFCDALICVSPRLLWDLDTGEPIGYGTVDAREVLEAALARPGAELHPVLNHIYIHLMEMSPYPELALPAADQLRRLSPDGSHLMHMATHIDNACGDWRRVVDSNLDAADADDKYFARAQRPIGWYTLYRAHYLMVAAYGGMMSGKSRVAIQSAHRLNKILTPEVLATSSPPLAHLCESYCTTLPHVLIRFGRWEDIIKLELPEDRVLYSSTTAMIHYARGIAFSALRRIPEAEKAREEFIAALAAVPEGRFNSAPVREVEVLAIAAKMLDGELEYRKGNFDTAFATLRQAIAIEDALPYSDPPGWLQPVRHAYCALLMEQGRLEEAAAQYRLDLGLDRALSRRRIRPNNVWSLHGLHECLTRLGRKDEADELTLRRDIAVASADVKIAASCFCRLSAFDQSPAG